MGDVKLFRLGQDSVDELPSSSVAVEKSLQSLIERHSEAFLGVRFLATEHTTGKAHGGRIDTLGIDENDCPVIIEYKRALNENVINQGLFYLNWLMDHKAEFELLVLKKYGKAISDAIEWKQPRLICIAGDFTKYDEHAVQEIPRNIELLRYRRYGSDLLLLELVSATEGLTKGIAQSPKQSSEAVASGEKFEQDARVLLRCGHCSQEAKDRYEHLRSHMLALGDDVQEKTLDRYIAFRRLKNFATVKFRSHSDRILVYVNVEPDDISLESGFTRDMRSVAGHAGVWQLELTIDSDDDLERAEPLIRKSYEVS